MDLLGASVSTLDKHYLVKYGFIHLCENNKCLQYQACQCRDACVCTSVSRLFRAYQLSQYSAVYLALHGAQCGGVK